MYDYDEDDAFARQRPQGESRLFRLNEKRVAHYKRRRVSIFSDAIKEGPDLSKWLKPDYS